MSAESLIVRPSFWNVPFWAEIAIYVLGLMAMVLFVMGVVRTFKLRRQFVLADSESVSKKSVLELLSIVFLQKRVSVGINGKFHVILFWGFIILFLGTAFATLDWDIAWLCFHKRLLSGHYYLIYKLVLDIAGLLVFVSIVYSFLRRFVFNDFRVEPTGRKAVILGTLAAIVVTGFCLEALRLAVEEPSWAYWAPVGYALSFAFSGLTEETLRTFHVFLWIVHGLTALCFIAAIPLTFYAHLFKTPASIRREKTLPFAALPKIEAIEEQEHFGIDTIEDLTLTDRIRLEGCTECGRCRFVCPAVKANTALDPKTFILSMQKAVMDGKKEPLVGTVVDKESLWSCTTCGACAAVCPARIPIPDMINAMRRHLALEKGDFPKGLTGALENTGGVGNPWGLDPGSRTAWSKGLDVAIAKPGETYDVLYWVGCSASYDKRAKKIAVAMVTILKAAKIKFAIMAEERCHAEWARRSGEEYLFQTAVTENIENLRKYSFKRILCHCPHCFNTLKNEYPQFENGRFDVVSHTEFIEELIREKRIELVKNTELGTVALHDACYLARANGVTEAPRTLLKLCGATLVEPHSSKENTLCCGAGGGQMFMDRPLKASTIRIKELKATKADSFAVECPHCLTMLRSGESPTDERIEDVSEIVVRALKVDGHD